MEVGNATAAVSTNGAEERGLEVVRDVEAAVERAMYSRCFGGLLLLA